MSAQYAVEHLRELFDAVDRGEEVAIDRNDRPTLKLTTNGMAKAVEPSGKRVLGALRGT